MSNAASSSTATKKDKDAVANNNNNTTNAAPPPLTNTIPAAEICQPLVQSLAKYVAAESAAVDGEWEHFGETHQLLIDAVAHIQDKSASVVSGIDESSKAIDLFLIELNSRTEEVECTLSVLESVSMGLEEYSKTLEKAFPGGK